MRAQDLSSMASQLRVGLQYGKGDRSLTQNQQYFHLKIISLMNINIKTFKKTSGIIKEKVLGMPLNHGNWI